jgi:ABC-2 type transport system permease protein
MSDLGLALNQVRYTNRAFWRNPASAFFTFAFPLMFLVIFTVLFGNSETCIGQVLPGRGCVGQTVSTSTFYVASISAFSVITACYTNIAISLSFSRDLGILKRIRGTPVPSWAYLFGRIVHAIFVAVLLVAICAVFGRLFYDARLPISTLGPFLLTLVVGAASFCTLGLAITSVIPNADASPAVVNASILPLLFISDVFIPLENPPAWLDFIAKVFPVKHFVEGMLASYFPLPGQSSIRTGDLLIVALWGLAGLLLTMRFFSWEPRR